jgi:two-component system phosphate regulon sensor histidine kinase PhoR
MDHSGRLRARPTLARAVTAIALAGGAGVLALVVLAASVEAAAAACLIAAALIAAADLALVLWLITGGTMEAIPPDLAVAPQAGQSPTPEPPYALALEDLPDPVILVAAGAEDDVSGPRLLFANAAAREQLRLQRAGGGLLAASIRNPLILEALDEALHGRIESDAVLDSGGAQDRVWRAVARPLPTPGDHRLALLLMRDETDARKNERMRADFLANASHELRTPLASLAGFIETLRGHAKDDPGARDRFLAIMTGQAERMARLIDDLMSLSRIELNEHIAPSGEADLSLVAMDVLDASTPLAGERGVRVEARLPPLGAAAITGDRDQILQVIQNLVDNAVKYAGRDGVVTVEVSAGVSAEEAVSLQRPNGARLSLLSPDRAHDGRYAALRVSDTGPGIAREYLPRLSERFYRVEGQKSGERAGTGLGLAIVKHIVNRHRGGLFVESAEGEGTTFTVYLPMARAPAAAVVGRGVVTEVS